jgi:hypothetical protein
MLVGMASLLGSLLAAPVGARHQDQAELSQVQDKLDAVAKVLADARADADQVARALVQADRDLAAARAALLNGCLTLSPEASRCTSTCHRSQQTTDSGHSGTTASGLRRRLGPTWAVSHPMVRNSA